MENVMRDNAPADLRKMNREKLAAMGVHEHVADIFIANGVYTPREQTSLVLALNSMANTTGREEYIKLATLTEDTDIAFCRERQAQMYAAFSQKVAPIARFIPIGKTSAGITKDGKLVFNVPLDHLLWTKNIAFLVSQINQKVTMMDDVKEKHLWISGNLSDLSRKSLQEMGWKIRENADSELYK